MLKVEIIFGRCSLGLNNTVNTGQLYIILYTH
jgi:hypothetical protein